MRESAKNFIQFKLGNGKDIYLWWDRWHPNGVLYERYGFRMVYEAVCKSNAKLESMLKNKDWSWSPAWSEEWWEFKANWLWFPLEM